MATSAPFETPASDPECFQVIVDMEESCRLCVLRGIKKKKLKFVLYMLRLHDSWKRQIYTCI